MRVSVDSRCVGAFLLLFFTCLYGCGDNGGPLCDILPDHRDQQIEVSCQMMGEASASGNIREELLFLHNQRLLDANKKVTITFWENDLVDKYGNEGNHVNVFAMAWNCEDLHQVNWGNSDYVDFSKLASARIDFNNLGQKYLRSKWLGGTEE